jgi:predicted AAA+ superfamily ATPase
VPEPPERITGTTGGIARTLRADGAWAASIAARLSQLAAAIARWLELLERIYAIFRLAPFGAPKIRAVKKAPKHHHYDWNVIDDHGARFENVIASHLLKCLATLV